MIINKVKQRTKSTQATVGERGPFLRALFYSGSGSLARLNPLFPAVIGFRAPLIFRHESPMGWLAIDNILIDAAPNKSANVFSSVCYIVTRATGSNPVEKWGHVITSS